MAPTRQRSSGHDPGKVLVDVALSLIDGGRASPTWPSVA
jgi:hypothetical protein